MRILQGAAAARYVRKLEQRGQKLDALEPQVRRIVQSVRKNGDRALRRYAARWDGLSSGDSLGVSGLRVLESEMQSALNGVSRHLRAAMEDAAERIRKFCEWQKITERERSKQGRRLGQLVRPVPQDAMFRVDATRSPQPC